MICRSVYTSALSLIGESADTTATAHYANRAPSLLTILSHRFSRLSRLMGNDNSGTSYKIESLDDEFPLDEGLTSAVAFALASLLVIDELPELAAVLEQRAEAEVMRISSGLASVEATREVYP